MPWDNPCHKRFEFGRKRFSVQMDSDPDSNCKGNMFNQEWRTAPGNIEAWRISPGGHSGRFLKLGLLAITLGNGLSN